MRNRSRLARKKTRNTWKNLILTTLGTLIILFLIVKFGIPALANLAFFFSSSKNIPSQTNTSIFVAPPILDPLINATNSAEITISGKAIASEKIKIYINDSFVDTVDTDKNGNFKSKQTLSEGENTIKAKAQKDNKESDYSEKATVSLIKSNPNLEVATPADGDSFSKDQKTITVSGKTDPGTSVTINGFWAVINENNVFSYDLPLQNGENKIKITVTDQAGNKTEKEIKVSYSQ